MSEPSSRRAAREARRATPAAGGPPAHNPTPRAGRNLYAAIGVGVLLGLIVVLSLFVQKEIFVGVAMAKLDTFGWHPLVSAAVMIVFGAGFGACQGLIIDFCEIQPFIVTLAGLFLLRGACFMVSLDSLPLRHPFVSEFASLAVPLPGDGFYLEPALLALRRMAQEHESAVRHGS